MFRQIKNIVDLIRIGASDLKAFKSKKDRREVVLNMLRIYFLLKDCADDGEFLVNAAQPNPVEVISKMEPEQALATTECWDIRIRKQGIRLYQLQDAIFGQDHLTVINPTLQEQIGEVVGYKMDRAVTLHGIGAALFFKKMFPIPDTLEEKARYISLMAGEESKSLNMARIKEEIAELREALDAYRVFVERMVSDDEILQLSKQARQDTRYSEKS
jgi:hypothetical protein